VPWNRSLFRRKRAAITVLAEGLRYAALRSAEFSDVTMPESVAAAPVTPFNVWDEASLTSDLETVSAKPFENRIE
jgi:hypothetical protein